MNNVYAAFRLHRNRNNCTAGCFTQSHITWEGDFNKDDGRVFEEAVAAYLAWTATASRYWSSYGTTHVVEGGKYWFTVGEALYVGREEDEGDYWSFQVVDPARGSR